MRRRGAAPGGGIGQLGAWGGPVPSFAARIAPRGRLELQDVPASVPLRGSLAVTLMSRKGRTTLYCGAQSVRSSRWNLCARCFRDDMPGGGRSAVLSAKELGLASMAARKARGAPRRLSACLPPDASALACSCHVNPARPRSVGCSGPHWLSRARTCPKSGSSRREMVPSPTNQEQAARPCGPGLILQVR